MSLSVSEREVGTLVRVNHPALDFHGAVGNIAGSGGVEGWARIAIPKGNRGPTGGRRRIVCDCHWLERVKG